MNFSIEELGKPVSQEMPSGENLEYDPEFLEMVELYEAKERAGASLAVPGKESEEGPDWKGVEKRALNLLQRTRDLRPVVYAATAALHIHGLAEFRDRLKLLSIYLSDFWESVHPQLDPEDGNDPLFRLNTLQMFNDVRRVESAFDFLDLIEVPKLGKVGVRQVSLAEGRASPRKNEEVLDLNLIRQAFASADPGQLKELTATLQNCFDLLAVIDEAWKNNAGDQAGIGLPVLNKGLERVSAILSEYSPVQQQTERSPVVDDAANPGPGSIATENVAVPGAIKSRADVVRVLDTICEYYAVNEPSSPVPLLLQRARGLVDKSFIEILQDMVPDGVQQAKMIGGAPDD